MSPYILVVSLILAAAIILLVTERLPDILTASFAAALAMILAGCLKMPIALGSAMQKTGAASLGVDPRPFIIGIAFGASACYATPIGYQTNLIVYGPGGYAFSDFMRLGLPMVAIACGGAALFIPAIWPF